MNHARAAATATLLPNSKVLIAGGFGGFNPGGEGLSSIEIYEPATNTFAVATPSMNTARAEATATLLPHGKVLIAGGEIPAVRGVIVLLSTEIYRP